MIEPKCPLLAVDLLIFRSFDASILLIERKFPPLGWALPGGFVDYNEEPIQAAIRELKEETGIEALPKDLDLKGVYGRPDRDPRRHVVSIVYKVHVDKTVVPIAGDDAKNAKFVETYDIFNNKISLCFDHREIICGLP